MFRLEINPAIEKGDNTFTLLCSTETELIKVQECMADCYNFGGNMNRSTNGKGNNSSRDSWETPQSLFNNLNNQYGFGFDCCASENNKKCDLFSDDFENILPLSEISWMNPPFSKAGTMFQHFFKVVGNGVAIYRCDNLETKVWQEIILPKASWIFIPIGRINYDGAEGNGARFPSALIGVNLPLPKLLKGTALKL